MIIPGALPLHQQTAYNCGLYTLWMALEAAAGRGIPDLESALKDGAKMYSDSVGGLFNYIHVERIVTHVNSKLGRGFTIKAVRFSNRQSFVQNIQTPNSANSAIMIAYSHQGNMTVPAAGNRPTLVYQPVEPALPMNNLPNNTTTDNTVANAAAMHAHWGLLSGANPHDQSQIWLRNPHGNEGYYSVNDIVYNNLILKGGHFNWPDFITAQHGTPIFDGELKAYKNNTAELKKRGNQAISLSGYFIAIN